MQNLGSTDPRSLTFQHSTLTTRLEVSNPPFSSPFEAGPFNSQEIDTWLYKEEVDVLPNTVQ